MFDCFLQLIGCLTFIQILAHSVLGHMKQQQLAKRDLTISGEQLTNHMCKPDKHKQYQGVTLMLTMQFTSHRAD